MITSSQIVLRVGLTPSRQAAHRGRRACASQARQFFRRGSARGVSERVCCVSACVLARRIAPRRGPHCSPHVSRHATPATTPGPNPSYNVCTARHKIKPQSQLATLHLRWCSCAPPSDPAWVWLCPLGFFAMADFLGFTGVATAMDHPKTRVPGVSTKKHGVKVKRSMKANVRPGCLKRPQVVTVASACSGMCMESFALKSLGIKHKLVVACEIKKHMRHFIRVHHSPKKQVKDITSKTFQTTESADIFCGGFPCQPFSVAGLGKGIMDGAGRGAIVQHMIRWIQSHLPKCFVLENVAGLVYAHTETFEAILQALSFKDPATQQRVYNVSWRLLNSSDFGVPQDIS